MAGKVTRVKAPKNAVSDLAETLDTITKAARKRDKATGIRRASKNPAVAGVDKSLQVVRAPRRLMPTAEELLARTEGPLPGESPRTPNMPRPAGFSGGMPTAEELLAMTEEGVAPSTEDRVEVLAPPPSLDPDRPRAREARYNPDTKQLTVVFRNGGTYVYYDVPSATWRALKRNRSFGQTMDRLVLNQYAYEKVAF